MVGLRPAVPRPFLLPPCDRRILPAVQELSVPGSVVMRGWRCVPCYVCAETQRRGGGGKSGRGGEWGEMKENLSAASTDKAAIGEIRDVYTQKTEKKRAGGRAQKTHSTHVIVSRERAFLLASCWCLLLLLRP